METSAGETTGLPTERGGRLTTARVDGEAVRQRRERLGLSAKQVGQRLMDEGYPSNFNPNTIYKIELGYHQPSLKLLPALANALECSMRDLMSAKQPEA